MPVFLGLLIAAIAVGTTVLFVVKPWWFPAYISDYGAAYDKHFLITLAVTGVVFILAQLLLSYMIFRFRGRTGGHARYLPGTSRAAVAGIAVVTLTFLAIDVGMEMTGSKIWGRARLDHQPAGALQVEVTGQQFVWNVRYAGLDGTFGRTKPELMKDAAGNPLGLDSNDAAARDDLVMPIMAVPVNRPVKVILRSRDMIHSFYVRELRLKQDAVPGMETRLHFTATRIGRYEIPCAELCGLGHYQMRSFLLVMSAPDFEKWLRDNAPQAQ